MKRKIIRIDEGKCTGCGLCIPNCQEGALQIIDGKARLISDLFCDGLGACIGHCPEDAIEIVEREAEPYDERKVMDLLVSKGRNTILAHLDHLRAHREEEFLSQAIQYIKENHIDMKPENTKSIAEEIRKEHLQGGCGCPGAMAMDFREPGERAAEPEMPAPASARSELKQWPVQLHLLNPAASYFRNADVVLTADCVPFAMANYHARYLKGHSIAIACPKLDSNKESYLEKITAMIKDTLINSLHVVMMEVPCCGGLLQMAQIARQNSGRNIPLKKSIISLQGEILEEEWA
jgi:Pyruvate/2-oxoacid:ferredoxin oxidoreductase delta subunit